MRLTAHQQQAIKMAGHRYFGNNVKIYLFGSRVDDHKKGGDIDLLVATDMINIDTITECKIKFIGALYQQIGEQNIDVLVDHPLRKSQEPIYQIARNNGVLI